MARIHPMTRLRIVTTTLTAIGLLGVLFLAACDQPCEKLTRRLEDCAAQEPTAQLYKDPRLAEELTGRCRRAEPRMVTACLAEKSCDELRLCASRALERRSGNH